MASVKVFGSPASTEVQRVLACLFEKQVEFQLVKMDNFRGHKRMPECLKMQPGGEALTYQDQEKDALVESRAICRHVVDKFKKQGNKELLGEGALERALIEQWLETEAQKFDPPSSELVFYLSIAPTLPDHLARLEPSSSSSSSSSLDDTKSKLDKVLRVYDQRLADNAFLAGSKFTLADLSHLPNAELLINNNNIRETKELFGRYDNVRRWWGQISERESWKKVLEIARQAPPLA